MVAAKRIVPSPALYVKYRHIFRHYNISYCDQYLELNTFFRQSNHSIHAVMFCVIIPRHMIRAFQSKAHTLPIRIIAVITSYIPSFSDLL